MCVQNINVQCLFIFKVCYDCYYLLLYYTFNNDNLGGISVVCVRAENGVRSGADVLRDLVERLERLAETRSRRHRARRRFQVGSRDVNVLRSTWSRLRVGKHCYRVVSRFALVAINPTLVCAFCLGVVCVPSLRLLIVVA